jgi:glycerol kinase
MNRVAVPPVRPIVTDGRTRELIRKMSGLLPEAYFSATKLGGCWTTSPAPCGAR